MSKSNQRNNKLIDAVSAGNLSEVNKLISEGIEINQINYADEDLTLLMLAIDIDRADIVQALIDAGADLYDSTYFEDTPLGLAATRGNLEILELLLNAGANPNYGGESPPLCDAVRKQHVNVIKALIQRNADVNLTTPSKISPLMIAAGIGNLEIVKLLVELGADVNATDDIMEAGNVALNKAACNGHQEVFDYLLPMTSDPEKIKYAQKELAIGTIRKQRIEQRKSK